MNKKVFLGMVIVLLITYTNVAGETIYVDAQAPGPIHNGSNWNDAYLYLQDALASASSGDVIRVAKGVYKPAGIGGARTARGVQKYIAAPNSAYIIPFNL